MENSPPNFRWVVLYSCGERMDSGESRITARDRTARHKNGPDIYGYGIGAEQKRGVMANRSNEHGNAGRFETGISGKLATQRIGSLQPDPLEQTP